TALPLAAQRQTFIVDAANGPGAQFTDLSTAVAAVPDGSVLLVRPGNYTGFSVTGKGLSIVGVEGDPTQVLIFRLSIMSTGNSQTFLLKSLSLGGVSILDARGAVICDHVNGSLFFGLDITRCDNVQLHRCSLAGPSLYSYYPATSPRVLVIDSTLEIS